MKTITFYSYKGGVGRTLSLVNIANLLEEFGKKVCIIDFDLEAPGLDKKYKKYITNGIKKGLVDYIHEFAINDVLPDSISDYCVDINHMGGSMTLLPAGNTSDKSYWNKLSRLNWWELFYQDHSEGIPFFLDLKNKIEKEINPDYLLIDTRTGITEISAITMSLLADSIVLFAANNEENISGIEQIIRSISREENDLLKKKKDIHFALTRIPLPQSPEERTIEGEIKNVVKKKLELSFEDCNSSLKSFTVIHSDRDTELSGKANICYRFNKKSEVKPTIMTEYLEFCKSLIADDLHGEGREGFMQFINAKIQLNFIYNNPELDLSKILEYLDDIEKLMPNSKDIYFLRGYYEYYKKNNFSRAEKHFKVNSDDESGRCLFYYAQSLFRQQQYGKAVTNLNLYISGDYSEYRINASRDLLIAKVHLSEDVRKLIAETTELIDKYPYYSMFYNIRSCLRLRIEEFEKAVADIYKAIRLEPIPLYYATSAEIKLFQGNKIEFFREMDNALKLGYNPEDILLEDKFSLQIYKEVYNDEQFNELLNRHDKAYFSELLKNKCETN